jgi:hypothetical protein
MLAATISWHASSSKRTRVLAARGAIDEQDPAARLGSMAVLCRLDCLARVEPIDGQIVVWIGEFLSRLARIGRLAAFLVCLPSGIGDGRKLPRQGLEHRVGKLGEKAPLEFRSAKTRTWRTFSHFDIRRLLTHEEKLARLFAGFKNGDHLRAIRIDDGELILR